MDKIVIERRLQIHILNLCLAVAGKREGNIALCKENLIHEVYRMTAEILQATREAR
jgi:hypothetical protein